MFLFAELLYLFFSLKRKTDITMAVINNRIKNI